MVVDVVKVEDTVTEEIVTKLPVTDEEDEEENNLCISSIEIPIRCLRKNLIILDLNGLLVDIVSSHPKEVTPDATIARNSCKKNNYYFFVDFFNGVRIYY